MNDGFADLRAQKAKEAHLLQTKAKAKKPKPTIQEQLDYIIAMLET